MAPLGSIAAAQTDDPRGSGLACESARHRPDLFRVAIDRDSGIAFVHTPCGYTYLGVVARQTIDEDIRMSEAEPVPTEVLRAELARQPALAKYLPGRMSARPVAGSAR